MEGIANTTVMFIAGFGPIVRESEASRKLYSQAFGIPFHEEKGGYLHTEALKGANSFALWPLSEAAQSCYGRDSWPGDVPIPQAWISYPIDARREIMLAAIKSRSTANKSGSCVGAAKLLPIHTMR
ncbi:glyoxalase/bleomycin resistance protein/dioxygenase [Cupriavidus basilensis OR16]|uniref:Glyoxalase/bleomycin resistance protein/dioxygenase n=1 Tax=Cupriavidus basilensis OR16 TaxID=1127483 RepID=H1S786_9BURK|nr:hypothetical protein [Cupriavidus basilensis]EHP41611.1 glyoxalase/bleomycin resistance protein/dioxygenase [Cupriavidus basilensis OR16]